jgi:hypothetical protein
VTSRVGLEVDRFWEVLNQWFPSAYCFLAGVTCVAVTVESGFPSRPVMDLFCKPLC